MASWGVQVHSDNFQCFGRKSKPRASWIRRSVVLGPEVLVCPILSRTVWFFFPHQLRYGKGMESGREVGESVYDRFDAISER